MVSRIALVVPSPALSLSNFINFMYDSVGIIEKVFEDAILDELPGLGPVLLPVCVVEMV